MISHCGGVGVAGPFDCKLTSRRDENEWPVWGSLGGLLLVLLRPEEVLILDIMLGIVLDIVLDRVMIIIRMRLEIVINDVGTVIIGCGYDDNYYYIGDHDCIN